jgi:HEPN domain-containing protein
MDVPIESILSKVRKWVRYADDDLRMALHALTLNDSPYRLVAYHAQQCAEKYLKAYLVFQRVDFPYTHNIARLLELCGEEFAALRDAEELSPYAITARYPGEEDEIAQPEAELAVETAEKVKYLIRSRLVQLGVGGIQATE